MEGESRERRERKERVEPRLGPMVRWVRFSVEEEGEGVAWRSAARDQSSVAEGGDMVRALLLFVETSCEPSHLESPASSSSGVPNSMSRCPFLTPMSSLAISRSRPDFRLAGRMLSHGPSYSTCHSQFRARARKVVACRLPSFGNG